MNKWVGIGRLTKDSELKFTPGKGTANLSFTMAIDDGYGENKKTYYIPVIVWGKSAENLCSRLIKGTQVAISGKIVARSYDAKDGTKKYVTEVVADNYDGIKLLGGKSRGNNNQNEYSMPMNDAFSGEGFEEDITPVDDGDMPF